MENVVINTGYKEYSINGDENAVIRVKTSDFGLMERLSGLMKKISAIVGKLEKLRESDGSGDILKAIEDADKEVKSELDIVFDYKVSEVVFGKMNCLSFAGGQPVALNFLEAIIPKIREDIEAEAGKADKLASSYIAEAKKFS